MYEAHRNDWYETADEAADMLLMTDMEVTENG